MQLRCKGALFGLVFCACSMADQPNQDPIETVAPIETPSGISGDTGTTGVTGESGATGESGPTGTTAEYLRHCNGMFAARIVELQIGLDASFPEDCDAPLRDPVGVLKQGTNVCLPGESANACLQRHYDSPPNMQSDLNQGCATTPTPANCLRGKWISKCEDGTDDGCAAPEAICADGVRPMAYIEAATTGGPSNKWVFYIGGEGGPCTGDECWFKYRYNAEIMNDNGFTRSLSTLHPLYATSAAIMGSGIHSGQTTGPNPFDTYNRVRLDRCNDGASTATELCAIGNGIAPALANLLPPGSSTPLADRFSTLPVFHKGLPTWIALFNQLTTLSGRDLSGDGAPDLPSLSNATTIIIAGSSDGGAWLTHVADRLAAELRLIAGTNVNVRVVIDGNYPTMLDGEARFHPNAPVGFNMLSNPYSETGLCELPDNNDGLANESCSAGNYTPNAGLYYQQLASLGTFIDESCVAMHGATSPSCFDRMHVLVHHTTTPFMVVADQEDETIGEFPHYSDDRSYLWGTAEPFRARVLAQTRDIVSSWSTAAREEGPGTPGHASLLLRKSRRATDLWGNHTHLSDDMKIDWNMTKCTAAQLALTSVSIAATVNAWGTGVAPEAFLIEDGANWNGTDDYWVTGNTCRTPL
jgi:hypothetical protein